MERTPPSKLHILSNSSQPFIDRSEAGVLLARVLGEFAGQNAVVIGIPRGGVVVAREIAVALDARLDVVLAHKLRAPGHEELAMGSISEDGNLFLNPQVVQYLNVTDSYIQQEKARQLSEIRRRAELIRKVRPKVSLKGRIVIVTDDGVATGSTTQAAFWAVRTEQPQRIIAAIPVGPESTIIRLAEDIDEMFCLRTPPDFPAVGQFYRHFDQVDDEEMLQILKGELERSG